MVKNNMLLMCNYKCCSRIERELLRRTPVQFYRKHKVRRAGIVIFDSDREYVLLVQSYASKWGFPKGKIEPGESRLSAAKRETLEETGISEITIDENASFQRYGNCDLITATAKKRDVLTFEKQDPEITGIAWVSLRCIQDWMDQLNVSAREYLKQ